MWIVGQDGSVAINTDNLENLSVESNLKTGKFSVTGLAIFGNDMTYVLGDYDTYQEALTVMDEILERLNSDEDMTIFNMPETVEIVELK